MRLLTFWTISALACQLALASVLAIDYGTDSITASLMKPGVPFDVLLNKDSKRKISSTVAWKNGDRLFGQDAFNTVRTTPFCLSTTRYLILILLVIQGSRFPSDTFTYLKTLLGVPSDAHVVTYYTQIASADIEESARRTVDLVQADGTKWAVEELVAMKFAYIKHLAELVANEKVTDVVVTVPPYYSQFERDAIADAIEISGLRTLAIINDGTAVAVNYAMTRTFPTPEYHVIYDAGSSGIRATVASFTTAKDPKTGAAGTHIAVAGVGYDRTTGGVELDRRMREILIDAFNAKTGKDIREDKRGMAKLWKEALRVKAILSANSEAVAIVESLAWDIDFKTKVTRAQFEEKCKDLKTDFAKPIEDALKNAGLTLDNVTSVIFTGGSTRIPMVQTAVKAAVGEYVSSKLVFYYF